MTTFNTKVVSALVSSVLSAVLTYIATFTPQTVITNFDWQVALGFAIITFAASMIKQLSTTDQGKFAGAVKVA